MVWYCVVFYEITGQGLSYLSIYLFTYSFSIYLSGFFLLVCLFGSIRIIQVWCAFFIIHCSIPIPCHPFPLIMLLLSDIPIPISTSFAFFFPKKKKRYPFPHFPIPIPTPTYPPTHCT
ncbi:hypothetical protein L873DRAFT_1148578 [Choiromyces venosus 120613-1]|uniref:Uncharacterized protein n=1 Tax=Choiromyces venosus 120613-1 TaxID=1336337 RepID=A0A3N4JTS5_9PEZI|nr:hypothetical protein L873DRAFT_1148578 [Choiromyces venosus 120613-1]